MRAPRGIAALLALAALAPAGCGPPPGGVRSLTIVAPRGPFATVEQAARSEARVNWLDADPRDDVACTASFAATELQRFLPACLGVPAASVRLSDSLPEAGDAVVLHLNLAERIPPEGYLIVEEASGTSRRITIEATDRSGLLYGAYALL